MRIFYFSYRWKFVNPTNQLLQEALYNIKGVFRYDPGVDVLEKSLSAAVKRHGPFDLMLIDGALLKFPGYPFWNRHIMRRQNHLSESQREHWLDDIFEKKLPIIVISMLADPHGAPEEYWQVIRKLDSFVLNPSYSFQLKRQIDLSWKDKEQWIDTHAHFFTDKIKLDKALLFPHAVSTSEILNIRDDHKYDVCILGAKYFFRRQALAKVESNGRLKLKRDDLVQKLLGLAATKRQIGFNCYRKRFMKSINNSCCSITCDGTIGYPVRKFFEIPAYGSVLIAKFFRNAECLGFYHGDNCFTVSENNLEEMIELIYRLKRDRRERKRITTAAQDMVRECHAVDVRKRQFLEIAEAVVSGRLQSTRWKRGKQVLIPREVQ